MTPIRFFDRAALCAALATAAGCRSLDDLWARAQDTAAEADAAVTTAGDPVRTPRRRLGRDPASTRSITTNTAASVDAGAPVAEPDAAVAQPEPDADAGAPTGPTITALWVWVPIFERMDSRGPKLGYLRSGASVRIASATPAGTDGCPRGWYALEGGGYVCLNRMTSLNPNELGRRTPTQPDLSAPMPYQYMTTYRPAVMYRWLPSVADMREVEPERFGITPPGAVASASIDGGLPVGTSNTTVPAGVTPAVLSTTAPVTGAQSAGTPQATGDAGRNAAAALVANRAQAEDAGVRIEDLQGEAGSPLLRRMLSGMYISVDREATSAGRRFWRTQNGGYVERGAVSPLRTVPTFQGVLLDEQHSLPVAFMTAFEGWTYDLSPDGRSVSRRERAPRLTAYHLTSDPPVTIGRNQYYRTRDGFYVSARNTRMVHTSTPPAEVGPEEKWIEVNLDRQMLIAYQGARPVYVTLVSTGRRNERAADRNYETIQGAFRIQSKHIATTMDGNSAGDGPYSIEDVPWVMYFENSFALHGAFWHNLFGYMRSHGCVNMSPPDARWLFHWTEPVLPRGWHGVYASSTRPGTRVYVHYENQPFGVRGGPDIIPQH
jgi:lipoprotein-anchoring transpeptidase ErfK/SrfK